MSELWIGTSGYVYVHWRRGVFYPEGLRQREELPYYAQRFRTVELNNPFYRLPAPESFDRWRAAVPDDFLYAVKASRYITHIAGCATHRSRSRCLWNAPSDSVPSWGRSCSAPTHLHRRLERPGWVSDRGAHRPPVGRGVPAPELAHGGRLRHPGRYTPSPCASRWAGKSGPTS